VSITRCVAVEAHTVAFRGQTTAYDSHFLKASGQLAVSLHELAVDYGRVDGKLGIPTAENNGRECHFVVSLALQVSYCVEA